MQEYFNLDIENNFDLNSPKEIKNKNGGSALLSSSYKDYNDDSDGPITIMTPPLRCSNVRIWPGKNDKFSKCQIELEITENEYRFTKFLKNVSDRCRYLITESANDWFKYTFSASLMRESYINLFIKKIYKGREPQNIQIQFGKNLLNDLDKQVAKSYRNQYLVLRLIFKGILISNGTFSEVWRADQIYKTKPISYYSDESDYNDSEYEDIGETISVKLNDPLTSSDNTEKEEDNKIEKEEDNNTEKEEDNKIEKEEDNKTEKEEDNKTEKEEDIEIKNIEDIEIKNIEDIEIKNIEIENEDDKKQEKKKNKKIIMSNNRRRKW